MKEFTESDARQSILMAYEDAFDTYNAGKLPKTNEEFEPQNPIDFATSPYCFKISSYTANHLVNNGVRPNSLMLVAGLLISSKGLGSLHSYLRRQPSLVPEEELDPEYVFVKYPHYYDTVVDGTYQQFVVPDQRPNLDYALIAPAKKIPRILKFVDMPNATQLGKERLWGGMPILELVDPKTRKLDELQKHLDRVGVRTMLNRAF